MIQKICSQCGKPFTGSCKYCTAKRNKRYNMTERNQERNAVYNSDWEKTKKYVLGRDNGICRMCKSLTPKYLDTRASLIVHHIVPVEDDQDLWYDHNNLISVCYKHHSEIHRAYETDAREKKRMQSRLRSMIEYE